MRIIEPCCAVKQVMLMRDVLGKKGTTDFDGYGDLSLTEFLPALLTRYSETEMMIIAPSLPEQATDIISRWMEKQWARVDGAGKIDVISHLTIITDLSRRKSPVANRWKKDHPFGERMTVIDKKQEESIILLPDLAVIGFKNMRYGEHFTATATTEEEKVNELWVKFSDIGTITTSTDDETDENTDAETALVSTVSLE